MDVILFWSLLSAVVASAAKSRGRSRLGWVLLSIVISPLLAGLFVLALPRLSGRPGNAALGNGALIDEEPGDENPASRSPSVDPSPASAKKPAFSPDGEYAGIPYKVSEAGAVEVMLSGGRVRFRSMEQFLALAIKDKSGLPASPGHQARPASG